MSDMKQFKVTSSRLKAFPLGTTVSEDDLVGANVEALLEGGHLSAIGSKVLKKETKEQD
jgi:hypothetical protein